MSSKELKILQINHLSEGGAARIALTLHQAFRAMGHQSWMLVGQKDDADESVVQFPDETDFFSARLFEKAASIALKANVRLGKKSLSHYLLKLRDPRRLFVDLLGIEDFFYPATRRLFELVPVSPDVVHLHNLHRNYFDLSFLPNLSSRKATLITLHDTWLLSGHCAYSLDCEKWKAGCGHCPHLESYPAVRRDATQFNWNRKKDIFSHSKFFVASPSQWILDKANESILEPAIVEGRVIHNGIDQSIFHPGNKKEVRRKLGISETVSTLLFVAHHGMKNPYKDFDTIWKAVRKINVGELDKEILLLVVGQMDGSSVQEEQYTEKMRVRYIPYLTNLSDLADYYRSADVYLQASRADTFPNVILESLACGTPVIATAVGGIPEQILDGITGYLVPVGDSITMAQLIMKLLKNEDLRTKMGGWAVEDAGKRFRLDQMVTSYLDWYYEILERTHSTYLSRNNV